MAIIQRRSRGYWHLGPNIYGRHYWCSRNTFANEIATPLPLPLCSATAIINLPCNGTGQYLTNSAPLWIDNGYNIYSFQMLEAKGMPIRGINVAQYMHVLLN